MSVAKMTLIGFYNALEDSSPLFEDLTLPDGIDKDLFVNTLLMDAGEFEVLYDDPDFFKNMVTLWGKKWERTFEKWYKAVYFDYDPLYNYDRHEEWITETDSSSRSDSTANRSSYDSATLQPYTSMNDSGTFDGKEAKNGRAYGNIGVTTSQQMFKEEMSVAQLNLYQHMIDLFKTELLIPIY